MKKYLLLAILFILISSCFDKQQEDKEFKEWYFGKVKSLINITRINSIVKNS